MRRPHSNFIRHIRTWNSDLDEGKFVILFFTNICNISQESRKVNKSAKYTPMNKGVSAGREKKVVGNPGRYLREPSGKWNQSASRLLFIYY